jgi:hypothetical protein
LLKIGLLNKLYYSFDEFSIEVKKYSQSQKKQKKALLTTLNNLFAWSNSIKLFFLDTNVRFPNIQVRHGRDCNSINSDSSSS